MISEGTIKSEARRRGVDPAVVDLDYVLGVMLWGLSTVGVWDRGWVLKGGTCLRKAYFPDYRFSEDLDFTVASRVSVPDVEQLLVHVRPLMAVHGIEIDVEGSTVGYARVGGTECIEARIPHLGVVRRTGPRRNIRLDISVDEHVLFQPKERPLLHPYKDADDCACWLAVYSLEEILVEKLRAVCGQRRHAIARDIYDIWELVRGVGSQDAGAGDSECWPNVGAALEALPDKCANKGVAVSGALAKIGSRAAGRPECRVG